MTEEQKENYDKEAEHEDDVPPSEPKPVEEGTVTEVPSTPPVPGSVTRPPEFTEEEVSTKEPTTEETTPSEE